MRSQPQLCFRNESYQDRANLTDEQQEYDRLWRASRDIQTGRHRPTRIAIGFKPRPLGESAQPLTPAKPIRDLDSVVAVMIIPVSAANWRESMGKRRYRFHATELTMQVKAGELQFSKPGLVFDFAKSPVQDHQVFSMQTFDPGSVGAMIEAAQEAKKEEVADGHVLTTPLAGDMVVTRDDLFINIRVGKTIIYRFNLDAPVEVEGDKMVKKGDTVAKLVGKMRYQVAELWDSGKPKMDLIGPDVLSATRFKPLFRLCNRLLDGIVDGEELPSMSASRLLPRLLAVLPDSDGRGDWVDAMRAEVNFEPSGELKKAILSGVKPGGNFSVQAPFDGVFVGATDFGTYKQVDYRDSAGKIHSVVLPPCAVLHGAFAEGQELSVREGDVVGDWIKRESYVDYIDLGGQAEAGLTMIEDAYLRSQTIMPGQRGFDGDGVAVDARLVEHALHLVKEYRLDFTNLVTAEFGAFYDSRDGSVGPVMLKASAEEVNGVGVVANAIRYLPPMRNFVEVTKPVNKKKGKRRSRKQQA